MSETEKDIVLVTVDALRSDATTHMPNVRAQFEDGTQGEAITAGAATNWVFPAILSGSYYTNAYNESGLVRDDWKSLPDILGDAGYETGAFLGFNPYLSKWEDRFDRFWNGGASASDEEWYSNPLHKWLSRGYRTALVKKRVSADQVINQAQRWYTQQSGPRFLWIHLMEPHGPYYPGLSQARDVGLVDTYRSIFNFQKFGDDTPEKYVQTQRQLYNKCVENVDESLEGLFEFLSDDTAVVLMADHGEEFNHGHYDHERLYDECVRVPFFSKNTFEGDVPNTVRQLDVPVEILHEFGQEIPDEWDGSRMQEGKTAFMLTPRPAEDTFQCALRTPTEKLIRTYDRTDGSIIRKEYYELDSDPEEMNNRYGEADISSMEGELQANMEEHQNALQMDPATGDDSEIVNQRLQDLGYK